MKLSWGYKIMFVYILFVIGIVFLAIKSSMQKYELVQPDYYAEELKYQSVIDATIRANEIGKSLTIKQTPGKLSIQLPDSFNHMEIKGKVHLYFAADISKDITKEFTTNNGELVIELLSTTKGNYTLKLAIEKGDKNFYYEQKIFL